MTAGFAMAAAVCGHYLLWSLLSVGGAIGLLPDMHRYLVVDRHWLDQAQFNAALALGQASPGPNMVLVSTLMGLDMLGLAGALLAPLSLVTPSTLLAMAYSRYSGANPRAPWLRALHDGMGPLTVGLLLSSGWLLARGTAHDAAQCLALAVVVGLNLRTRIHPLWLLAGGALAGVLGWI